VKAVVEDDLLVRDVALDADELRGGAGDARNLRPGLFGLADPSMPITVRGSLLCAKPAIMPAWVPPVTEQTTT